MLPKNELPVMWKFSHMYFWELAPACGNISVGSVTEHGNWASPYCFIGCLSSIHSAVRKYCAIWWEGRVLLVGWGPCILLHTYVQSAAGKTQKLTWCPFLSTSKIFYVQSEQNLSQQRAALFTIMSTFFSEQNNFFSLLLEEEVF